MSDAIAFLVKGGVVMIPLFLCSLLGLTIVVEKMFSLRRSKILIPEIIAVVDSINSIDDIKLATTICQKNTGPFANIILTGLHNQALPIDDIKELINDEGRQQVRILERGLPLLETLAGVSPLLGLLGTVFGMIKVFNVISVQGSGQAGLLAGGISEALITTAAGLVVGIPMLVAYHYYTNRAENYIMDIEKYSTRLIQKIRIINNSNKS
ncbi:MAG TPA: MotA/TolQ/ExbB proton channel family protein [bacterium]|nr:MotA/TolQ/ExbB proton channel family protein [bacterium]HPN44272.1 MotA/TolQ/ExbB proton channel family protein [bacterium]